MVVSEIAMDSVRLLLVEDDPGDRRLFLELLRETEFADCPLCAVDRVEGAVARLREARYTAVFCDLSLPDTQGVETVERLAAAARDTPIIVMAGVDSERLPEALSRAGAHDLLLKNSVRPDELSRLLRRLLQR